MTDLWYCYKWDKISGKDNVMDDPLAFRLKARRDELGLTQAEISQSLGIAQAQYSRYEKGTMPKRDTLVKLAEILSCTTDYLLGIVDKPTENKEFESLLEDEKNLVLLYRRYKRDKRINRLEQRILRDLGVDETPAIESPQEADIASQEITPKRKVV